MNKQDLIKFDYIDSLVLELNVDDSDFQKLFISIAPEMASDIRSASLNKSCSCRGRIVDYVWSNLEKIVTLITDCYDKKIITFDLNDIEKKYKKENISGKVAKTSIKEWPSFLENLKTAKYDYSTFHLVKENDDIFVFFS
jgi:hypothetical protein